MGELVRLIIDTLTFVWPFRMVKQWERANYYTFGRQWKTLGPGIYPVVPFFTEVHAIPVVPSIVSTGRCDITLKDGNTLSFSASATCRVVDVDKAVNTVDSYTETTQEIVAAVLSDRLADVETARLAPEGKRRLLSDLRRWVAEETALYGIEVTNVRFTSFVLKPRTYRLLGDGITAQW